MLVGLPNRVLNQMCAELMANQDFAKFVFHKEHDGDVLSLPNIENPHKVLKNKHVFINRRIPKILHDYDVNVFLTLSRWKNYTPYKGNTSQNIDELTVKVVVLMQETCLTTANGNRDLALVSIIKNIVESSNLGGLGKCLVEDVSELYALPLEYHGFEMYIKVHGFKNLKVQL